jgi:hypothetical protein
MLNAVQAADPDHENQNHENQNHEEQNHESLSYRLCPRCTRTVHASSNEHHCINDGTRMLEACPVCGTPITNPYARYCATCGHEMTGQVTGLEMTGLEMTGLEMTGLEMTGLEMTGLEINPARDASAVHRARDASAGD